MEPDDLVVTADVPLAAAAIDKGGVALNPRGELYTQENVRERLSMRNFMDELRQRWREHGRPAALSQRERQLFANQLDRWLAKRAKALGFLRKPAGQSWRRPLHWIRARTCRPRSSRPSITIAGSSRRLSAEPSRSLRSMQARPLRLETATHRAGSAHHDFPPLFSLKYLSAFCTLSRTRREIVASFSGIFPAYCSSFPLEGLQTQVLVIELQRPPRADRAADGT